MTTHTIPTADRHPVVADLYLPQDPACVRPGIVVMCHGFKGHRRWGFIPYLAGRLVEAGMAAVSIDFSFNGRVAEDGETTAPERPGAPVPFRAPGLFRRNTLSRERADLCHALAWVRRGAGGALAADPAVGLWGHSRGGVVALLAVLDGAPVVAVATWSTAAHPDFYTPLQKARWRSAGAYEFTDAATGTPLALGVEYLDDIETHAAEYAVANRVALLGVPHLIVHGEHDLVIPVEEAGRLFESRDAGGRDRRPDKRLLRLVTGHTFGYEGDDNIPAALDRAAGETAQWFSRYLAADTEKGTP